MAWYNLGGAAIGAIASSQSSDGPSQESKKEPWGPAVPWLTQNLKTGQDLQGFYQKNPFSDQQKIGMQNQLGMADQFNSQMMPGLMGFANKGMTSQYQRASGGAPGSGAGYGGAPRQAGLLSSGAGPFSAPKTQAFGQVDWDKINPFSAQNGLGTTQAAAPAADPLAGLTPEQIQQLMQMLGGYGGPLGQYGGGGNGATGTGNAGSAGTGGVGGGVGGTDGSGD
jgi:hypothetical protein